MVKRRCAICNTSVSFASDYFCKRCWQTYVVDGQVPEWLKALRRSAETEERQNRWWQKHTVPLDQSALADLQGEYTINGEGK